MKTQDEKIAAMTFAMIYPSYVNKIEKKGRTEQELQQVIEWLTGYDAVKQQELIDQQVSFGEFFDGATIPESASLITGSICGVNIQNIENPLTKHVRYLDKIVDELAKGREVQQIMR